MEQFEYSNAPFTGKAFQEVNPLKRIDYDDFIRHFDSPTPHPGYVSADQVHLKLSIAFVGVATALDRRRLNQQALSRPAFW